MKQEDGENSKSLQQQRTLSLLSLPANSKARGWARFCTQASPSAQEVRTRLHLLCSTRQCTDGCSCCSNYGGTSWWQNCAENDSVCPRVCEQARGGWRKWTDCLLSDTGRLRPPGLTAVPSLRLCITSTVHHPSQGASLQLTPGRQSTKGVTVDVSALTFYNPKYFPSHRGNKTRISFLVCGRIFQPFRPRLHLYNILSIQKLSQETWKPALNWDELKPLLIGKAIHSRW